MDIKQALVVAAQKLKTKKVISSGLDAEILLAFVLKKDKAFLYTYPEKKLTAWQLKKFNQLILKRSNHRPLAYLVGQKEFYKLNFKVNNQVLIPRPETELLVDEVLKLNKNLVVADIGTGSGCIAVSLAKNGFKQVLATDSSKKALKTAKENAKSNQTASRIKFFPGDLSKPVADGKPEIICANLPYLSNEIYKQSVKSFPEIKKEPRTALIAAEKGLYFYKKLLSQIAIAKHQPQYLFFEIDSGQSRAIKKIIRSFLETKSILIKKDLCGLDRLVIVKLK
ncbi:MAG TPA: peptide chain release factor N(5)-glutamine methyltransferase [Candidatus Bipolaricaulota bacterium]|nr:peptide chain release factor N(5)-glutamine methyltransferase [Candidatus Bipolaricaulota bacterium]